MAVSAVLVPRVGEVSDERLNLVVNTSIEASVGAVETVWADAVPLSSDDKVVWALELKSEKDFRGVCGLDEAPNKDAKGASEPDEEPETDG
ncbi:hypothetical protein QQS21_001958 [Conoideocrella luteorostrata]|uniref:Uncharacterized protein n=1 Tax=Conoideocrella luteorostrata TaxID=1105319 RepID=A0AAJ0CZ38_9HYPO|nr:hypothetical protein QQS21_001958 [Conoideocrella luteorostrata]